MKKNVILIHGLTGTPATMAPLAEALAKNGFKVITPLLAGHGTSVEALTKTPWEDWFKDICLAYNELSQGSGEIYCCGLSLGSLLTLKLALDASYPLKKIACLGTPLKLSPVLEKLVLPMSHLPPLRQLIKYSIKDLEISVADRIGREIYSNASYSKIPVHAVWELQKLQKDVLSNLPNLNTETIIIHSRMDKVALPFNVELFCKTASKINPKIVWLDKSEHVETLDCEKDIVEEEVVSFFTK